MPTIHIDDVCPVLYCREELEDEITIVFDCRNAGLKNMDMEFMQFIIGKNVKEWPVFFVSMAFPSRIMKNKSKHIYIY